MAVHSNIHSRTDASTKALKAWADFFCASVIVLSLCLLLLVGFCEKRWKDVMERRVDLV